MPLTRPGGLRIAALLTCALFIAEDPAVLAVRGRLGERVVADAVLAAVMVSYNYAASRYVVASAAAVDVADALERVELDRTRRIAATRSIVLRALRRLGRLVDPFRLLSTVAGGLGRAVESIGERAGRRGLGATARVVGDLGVVNVLGVPGAGLAASSAGAPVARRDSLRHAALFVLSWFAGARAIGALVDLAAGLPVVGDAADRGADAVASTFRALTDVTAPLGAVTVALVVGTVARRAGEVERVAAADPSECGKAGFQPSDTPMAADTRV